MTFDPHRLPITVQWTGDLQRQSEPHLQSVRAMQAQSEKMSSQGGASAPERLTVLIVKDDEFQQKILCRLVGQEKHHFEVAATVAAARDAIGRQRPALILLDFMLPDADGVTLGGGAGHHVDRQWW